MGFTFRPIIVFPQRLIKPLNAPITEDVGDMNTWERWPMTFWVPHAQLQVGHVTRVQKLTDATIGITFSELSRASICFTSVITNALYDRIEKDDIDRAWLAPEVLTYKWPNSANSETVVQPLLDRGITDTLDFGEIESEFNFEFKNQTVGVNSPIIQEHNATIRMSDEALDKAVRRHFQIHPPIHWASCEEVERWFKKAEEDNSEEFKELAEYPLAKAQFNAWRSYITALAPTEARVVLLFPMT